MKIGISTSVIQRGKTGVAQYLFGLIRALEALNSNDEFYLFVLREDHEFFESLGPRFSIISVEEKFRPPLRNILWHQTVLPRLARELALDVLHIPSYRRLPWRSPCPTVATIHDLAPFTVSRKYDMARMFYGRVVVKYLARMQERIIAVSGNTAADIERFFGISGERLKVVRNGLDHQRFFPRPSAAAQSRARGRFGLEQPYLLYVARLEHPGKNHFRLIEAFETFKTETRSPWLLALGGSDWSGAEVIHQRINESPFKDSIRPLGFIPDDEVPWLYSGAASFIYPSLYEGFGMPPTEAMACGCPVICSDRGALGEIVSDAAWKINPENSSEMAGALVAFFRDSNQRSEFTRKGLVRAAEFSWEKAAKETLAVYGSVLGRRRSSSARSSVVSSSCPA
jgi:glycosyltransferase involved in cell wall biosynthesis